jgi:AraC-like DNA-binding protein
VGSEAKKLLQDCGLKPGTICTVQSAFDIERFLEVLIEHGLRGGPAAGELCNALFKYLLIRIAFGAASSNSPHSPAHTTYLRCRDQIERNYAGMLSLGQVADAVGVDEAYICRLFQRYDTQSPYQMLVRLKMNHAAELLRNTKLLVKDVAKSLGYADAFHFSRAFKIALGVSPQAFRRLNF